MIIGAAGVGKTTLMQSLLSAAREDGTRVLEWRAGVGEADQGLIGLTGLLSGVRDHELEQLPAPQRTALRIALLREPPGGLLPEARAVAAATASLLALLAAAGPVLVAVDDLHRLDGSTCDVMAFAARWASGDGFRILCTRRTGTDGPARGFEEGIPTGGLLRHSLGPLSDAAIARILIDHEGISYRQAERVARAAVGNPLMAIEIAAALAREGEPPPGEPLPVPTDVRLLVEARVARLPEATRLALLRAASRSSPEVAPEGRAALEPAERAGMVRIDRDGLVRFEHPLHAAAVRAAASAPLRRQIHAELAAESADAGERARHLAMATVGRDASVAAVLAAAADDAARRGATQEAVDLAGLALRMTPDDGPLAGRRIDLARLSSSAGDLDGARILLEEALVTAREPGERGRALRLLGEVLCEVSFPEATVRLDEALALVDGSDAAEAAAIHLRLAFAHGVTGDIPRAAGHQASALRLARAAGDDALLAEALGVEATLSFLSGRGRDDALLSSALALEDPHRIVVTQQRPRLHAAILWAYTDDVGPGVEMFGALWEAALAAGRIGEFPFLSLHLGHWAVARGDVTAAREIAAGAVRASVDVASPFARATAPSVEGMLAAHLGDAERARGLLSEGLSRSAVLGTHLYALWPCTHGAALELAVGNPEAALAWVAPLLEGVEAGGMPPEPAFVIFMGDAIEALIGLRQYGRAEALLDAYEDRGRTLGRRSALAVTDHLRALLAAEAGDLPGARAAAQAASAGFEDLGLPVRSARALLALGRIERRLRRRAAAHRAFRAAEDVLSGAGALAWAAQAAGEARRSWSPRSDDALTPSERRVAELAAQGHSNPEIASTLFISRRTVEATLSRVYDRLGIRRRTQLAGAMARLRPSSGD